MTAQTTDGYTVTSSTVYEQRYAWKTVAQYRTVVSDITTLTTQPGYINITFPKKVILSKMVYNSVFESEGYYRGPKDYIIYASNDNFSTLIELRSGIANNDISGQQTIDINSDTAYRYYRIYIVDTYNSGGNKNIYFYYWQLYGYEVSPQFTPLIPTMTSNTLPSGICSASSKYSTDYESYQAFDGSYDVLKRWTNVRGESNPWLAYLFPTPVVAKDIEIYQIGAESSTENADFKIQASNDSSNWIDLTTTFRSTGGKKDYSILLNNSTAYTSYRIMFTYLSYAAAGVGITEVQLYK